MHLSVGRLGASEHQVIIIVEGTESQSFHFVYCK